jgi:hypothetical protein
MSTNSGVYFVVVDTDRDLYFAGNGAKFHSDIGKASFYRYEKNAQGIVDDSRFNNKNLIVGKVYIERVE